MHWKPQEFWKLELLKNGEMQSVPNMRLKHIYSPFATF